MKKHLLTFLGILLSSMISMAQITTSGISGRVTDEKGHAMVGTTIMVTHVPSGTQYGTSADTKGNYLIANIRPGGPYTITVSRVGYATIHHPGIGLSLGAHAVFDYVMQEKSVQINEIIVRAEGIKERGNSLRSGATTRVNTNAITRMPSISRSLTDIIRLTPQANGAAIGGGTFRQNNITIDGASFNNKFGIGQSMPANGSPISLDAIEQVSVSITPYDVRQSGFLGASINAVTRSGGNEFRGSVYTYMNSEKLRGNKIGEDTFERVENRFNLYGMRLGGPIIEDKLFFFISAEIERGVSPGPSRVAATESHPYIGNDNPNIAYATAGQLQDIRDFLKNRYGYETGPYQGYSLESPGHKVLVRVDWNINQEHHLNIRYNMTKGKNPQGHSTSNTGLPMVPFTSGNRRANQAIWFQNSGYFQEENFYSLAAELNSTFRGINNQFRIVYTNQDEPRSTGSSLFPFVDIRIKDGGRLDGQALTSFGTELFSLGNRRQVKTVTLSDDITWYTGMHHVTAGVQFEHNKTQNGFQRFGSGYYTYDSWEDFVSGAPALQFAITHSNNPDKGQAFPTFKFNQLTGYLQDEITIGNRFSLLAGLRLDLPIYPDINTRNPKITEIEFKEGQTFDTGKLPGTRVLFSPRIGFNYDILSGRELVLRGGTGVFTGTIPFVWIIAQASEAGVLQTSYRATQTSANTLPAFYVHTREMLDAIYPAGFTPGEAILPEEAVIMDRDLKLPQSWKSSLTLDVRLPGKIRGTIEGIYSTDINAVIVENAGLKGETFKIDDYADQRDIWKRTYYNNTLKDLYVVKNGGKSRYWSVTTKLEKQFSTDFQAMIAYTRSHSRTTNDGVGDQVASTWTSNPTVNGSNAQEMGFASYVLPDKVIASLSYRKAYAKHFATCISLFYTGASSGRYSYTYVNRLNNDNTYAYSLMYVPKDDSEITFVDQTIDGERYTADEQRADFWEYINNDKYLRGRVGKYAERNGGLLPWVNRCDLKILQDFFIRVNGKPNTLQLGVDIINVGNLINKNWGHSYSSSRPYMLNIRNLSAVTGGNGTVKPQFNFYKDNVAHLKNIGYSSAYYMQFSIRYIFNGQ